jgi:hypothetical protein
MEERRGGLEANGISPESVQQRYFMLKLRIGASAECKPEYG